MKKIFSKYFDLKQAHSLFLDFAQPVKENIFNTVD